jgi:hypothetical protein
MTEIVEHREILPTRLGGPRPQPTTVLQTLVALHFAVA